MYIALCFDGVNKENKCRYIYTIYCEHLEKRRDNPKLILGIRINISQKNVHMKTYHFSDATHKQKSSS